MSERRGNGSKNSSKISRCENEFRTHNNVRAPHSGRHRRLTARVCGSDVDYLCTGVDNVKTCTEATRDCENQQEFREMIEYFTEFNAGRL